MLLLGSQLGVKWCWIVGVGEGSHCPISLLACDGTFSPFSQHSIHAGHWHCLLVPFKAPGWPPALCDTSTPFLVIPIMMPLTSPKGLGRLFKAISGVLAWAGHKTLLLLSGLLAERPGPRAWQWVVSFDSLGYPSPSAVCWNDIYHIVPVQLLNPLLIWGEDPIVSISGSSLSPFKDEGGK